MNMNSTFKFSILILTLGVILFAGCVKKEFDKPPVVIPTVDFPSNTTIAQLKAFYNGEAYQLIDTDLVVKGVVIANDESGNIYKTLYIQDATGGLLIGLDRTSLYTKFKPGQRIFIKCNGMYLGTYGGVVQLGYLYNNAIGRLPDVLIDSHLFRDSLPGVVPSPLLRKISTISGNDICMLVQIDSLHFTEPGLKFSESTASTDRNMQDNSLNTLILRTSNYANFAAELLPSGTGSVVGILSMYNSEYQFYIRDLNDLKNWIPDTMATLINETFATSLGTFTQYSVTGTETWAQYITPSSITCAKMSGYTGGTNYANEDWLISGSLNFDNYIYETLSFQTAMRYGSPADGSFKVYYSSNYISGNPTSATWTEVTVPAANLPSGADWNFVQSGNLDLSAASGSNVHIAFKYTSTTAIAATWEITAIKLRSKPN